LTQQRAEKERDTLLKSNSRLLKQSTEKDDMNAKSLSTILHLKHMTEQLTTEKGLLEQQVKSAEQLALAARLATNAKERVTEEIVKEKDVSVMIQYLPVDCLESAHKRPIFQSAVSRSKGEGAGTTMR
jgi:E3 ubiquitin-protein ligase BRE1